MHSRTMAVDGVLANIGSANLDDRSLANNAEVNLVVYDAGFAAQLGQSFQEDLKYSKKLTYEAWSSRRFTENKYWKRNLWSPTGEAT
jgi:cardiolipin synthase A/B